MEKEANRVLYIIGGLGLGGTERHLGYIAPRLIQNGISVYVFSTAGHDVLSMELHRAKVPVFSPRGSTAVNKLPRFLRWIVRPPLAVFTLLVVIMKLRPHIVHMFLPEAYILGSIASILGAVPIKVMSRRSRNHYQGRRPIFAKVERIFHQRISAALGNSLCVMNDLRTEGIEEEKVHLIYNGIPLPCRRNVESSEVFRAQLGIPPETLVMVITANLIAYKGHADLINALAIVEEEIDLDYTLLCIGDDRGLLPQLEQQALDLGLNDRLLWMGRRENVRELLAICDIAILCSHEEGFSNAVLEYMAAELPAIVTDVGGNAEAIVDNECGLVVPPRNVEKLAIAVAQLAVNPKQRIEMGKAGRKRVEKYFTIDRCIENYLLFYEFVKKRNN